VWHSYRGQQFAPILASAYGAYQAVTNDDPEQGRALWVVAALGAAHAMSDSTWFQSIAHLGAVFDNPERNVAPFLESQARSLVPGPIRAVARANDAIVRDPQNPIEAAMSVIPGLSEQMQARQTAFGEPQTKPAGAQGLAPVVNPFRSSPERNDPLETELARLQQVGKKQGFRVEPNVVGGKLSVDPNLPEVELTPQERAQYGELAGSITYMALSQLVGTSGWDQVPDEAKAKEINKTAVRSARMRGRLKPSLVPRAVETSVPAARSAKLGRETSCQE
jgi:hypothetical protein